MLTIGVAGICFAAGLLGVLVSLSAVRHYRRKAWYGFWAGLAVCVISAVYGIAWMLCYRM